MSNTKLSVRQANAAKGLALRTHTTVVPSQAKPTGAKVIVVPPINGGSPSTIYAWSQQLQDLTRAGYSIYFTVNNPATSRHADTGMNYVTTPFTTYPVPLGFTIASQFGNWNFTQVKNEIQNRVTAGNTGVLGAAFDNYVVPIVFVAVTTLVTAGMATELGATSGSVAGGSTSTVATTSDTSLILTSNTAIAAPTGTDLLAATATSTSATAPMDLALVTNGTAATLSDAAIIDSTAGGLLQASINTGINAAIGTTGAAVTDATLAQQIVANTDALNPPLTGAQQLGQQLVKQAEKSIVGALTKAAPKTATPATTQPAATQAAAPAPIDWGQVLVTLGMLAAFI